MIRNLLALAAMAFVSAQFAAAQPPADVKEKVLAAFLTLNDGENKAAAAEIVKALADSTITESDWYSLVKTHFDTGSCSPAHVALWGVAIQNTQGDAQRRAALVAGMFAAHAFKKGLPSEKEPKGSEATFGRGLDLLHSLADGLGVDGRTKVLKYVAETLGEYGAASLGLQNDSKSLHAYMQFGLTMRAYAVPSTSNILLVSRIMGLQGAFRAFWETHGIFLFDPGVLNAQQIAILNQITGAIPKELHNIGAFVVTGTARINLGQLVTPFQTIFIDPTPLSVRVNPLEFYERLGLANAPEFAVSAAQRIFTAIQVVQFARRPELVLRRNIILYRAGRQKERYLRRYDMIAPATYHQNPESFLPAIGYLWIMDSVRTFAMAGELFEIEQREAMDSYLLFADMLSGGGGTTFMYIMAPDGSLRRDTAAINRVYVSNIRKWMVGVPGVMPNNIPVDMYVCNGIAVAGWRHWFTVDELGATVRINSEIIR